MCGCVCGGVCVCGVCVCVELVCVGCAWYACVWCVGFVGCVCVGVYVLVCLCGVCVCVWVGGDVCGGGYLCVWMCVFVCVGGWVCVCGFFFINIYLQPVPLHGNTTCFSVHVIHCLSFWSVFGTTCGDLFRTMTITVFENQLT